MFQSSYPTPQSSPISSCPLPPTRTGSPHWSAILTTLSSGPPRRALVMLRHCHLSPPHPPSTLIRPTLASCFEGWPSLPTSPGSPHLSAIVTSLSSCAPRWPLVMIHHHHLSLPHPPTTLIRATLPSCSKGWNCLPSPNLPIGHANREREIEREREGKASR
jgi:hypothetical protein